MNGLGEYLSGGNDGPGGTSCPDCERMATALEEIRVGLRGWVTGGVAGLGPDEVYAVARRGLGLEGTGR
jgi:hypothetical protein